MARLDYARKRRMLIYAVALLIGVCCIVLSACNKDAGVYDVSDKGATLEVNHFIAKFIEDRFILGSQKHCFCTALICFLEQIQDFFFGSADTESKHQTSLILKNSLHTHYIRILNRININANSHKTQLHLTCRKS